MTVQCRTEETGSLKGQKSGNIRRGFAWWLEERVGLMKMFLNRRDLLDLFKVIMK